jgi:hypothetical protein
MSPEEAEGGRGCCQWPAMLKRMLPYHRKYFVSTSIFILFGLALLAMVINVIGEFFSVAAKTAKKKVIKNLGNSTRRKSMSLDPSSPTNEKLEDSLIHSYA